jgi:hypothetical protein
MSGRPGRDAHAPLLVFYALRAVSAIPILVSLYTSSSFTRFACCFVLWLVLSVLYRFSDAYAPEKKRRKAFIAIGVRRNLNPPPTKFYFGHHDVVN